MNVNSSRLFQLFKYTIYALLMINVYVFFVEEFNAAKLQFSTGVALGQVIEAYAATIDTAAWVVLLLMFELETYVLEDRHFTPLVARSLKGVRVFCYVFIVYAFYGYVANLIFVNQVTSFPAISDLCAVVADNWSYAVDLDEYVGVTAANCSSLSAATEFMKFQNMPALVDAAGFKDIRNLAWVDAINSSVWLLVVLVLEVDVRLQERNRFEGFALVASSLSKTVLYSLLLLAAIFWGFKGDFVDFWDAFLWLVAFAFIELNIFEWRRETKQGQTA